MGNIDTFNIINEIRAERERQKDVEGWTEAHDDTHVKNELSDAAACYAINGPVPGNIFAAMLWPADWDIDWFKPTTHRRNLIKAAALIVAEIERLDRMGDENGMGRGTDA